MIAAAVPHAIQTSAMLELSVNGELKRFDGALDVERLLERLALAGKKVAVERNGEIVPRSRYAATPLASGDRLEIVVAVGGG
jgi:sulfur carrier protein